MLISYTGRTTIPLYYREDPSPCREVVAISSEANLGKVTMNGNEIFMGLTIVVANNRKDVLDMMDF